MSQEAAFSRVTARRLILLAMAGLALSLAVMAACSFVGVVDATWIIWQLRMERLVVASVVGAGLAVGGMALQGLLRNPLAEPYILGISSGASIGVLLGVALAASLGQAEWATTPVLALVGALVTVGVVYGISQRRGRLNPYVLLLSGVIVNVFNGAVIMAILTFLSRDQLLGYVRWGMGVLPSSTDPTLLAVCGGCIVLGWGRLLTRGWAFNALGLGDEVASSSGVSVHYLRIETFVVVGLMTSSAVALAGPIGFIGLIVPHVARMIVGADHRVLAIASGFGGAVFLMIADTVGRSVGIFWDIGEIPVGVITALSGGPFFIALLRRRFKESSQ